MENNDDIIRLKQLKSRRLEIIQELDSIKKNSISKESMPVSENPATPLPSSNKTNFFTGKDGLSSGIGLLMVLAAFLPWAESTGNFLGETETLTASSFDTGLGYIILLLGLLSSYFGLIRSKLVFLPASVNALIGFSGLMLGRSSGSFADGMVTTSGGFGIGVILLIASSLSLITLAVIRGRKNV